MIELANGALQAGTEAAHLRILLLGPPDLRQADAPLALLRRQVRAVLYRLAASQTPVPRDQLCFLLWPDAPQATARRNLTVLLNLVRRALPLPELLVTHNDALGLAEGLVWSDAAAFAELERAARQSRRSALLEQAVELYRGPFLDGFGLPDSPDFEEWIADERRGWDRRYLATLEQLVAARTGTHDWPGAIAAAQRYLATDGLAEEMHRQLIALYAHSGDRAAALRQYERCVALLERELGVEPLPETTALVQRLRGGELPTLDVPEPGDSSWDTAPPLVSDRPPEAQRPPQTLLPAPTGPLIGRADDLAVAAALVQHPDKRLVTLWGAGGSGKTRLAQQLAWNVHDTFTNGVVFVALAPLSNPALVQDAIAEACGVRAQGGRSAADALRAFLRSRHLLLVLDNFEHVLAAAPLVAGLLADAPRLHILVTSRARLHLTGEHAFGVRPLALPDIQRLPPPAELLATPAVALFVARVQARDPQWTLTPESAATIAAICVRLDGLPLAIELAAARMRLLGPDELLRRLDTRLQLLTDGPRDLPERQRTLRATLDWSYRLLNTAAQQLLGRLAVFHGGWSIAAAEAICGAVAGLRLDVLAGLEALGDAQLIVRADDGAGEARYTMLETIRAYAVERLREQPGAAALAQAHAGWYAELAERLTPALETRDLDAAMRRLDRDYHNLRAALEWSLAADDAALAALLVAALPTYWDMRGLLPEGRYWSTRMLPLLPRLSPQLRNLAVPNLAFLAYRGGDLDRASDLASAIAADPLADDAARMIAISVLGLVAVEEDRIEDAHGAFEQAVAFARANAVDVHLAGAEGNLGICFLLLGDVPAAFDMLRSSLEHYEAQGHPRGVGLTKIALSFIAIIRTDFSTAAPLLHSGMQHLAAVGETPFLLYGLLACAAYAAQQQRAAEAMTLFAAATQLADTVGMHFCSGLLGLAHSYVGRARAAATPLVAARAAESGRALDLAAAVRQALALF